MRKVVKGTLCALALVCAFGLGQSGEGYTENELALAREEAYNSGYHIGYEAGLTARQESLYEEAFAAGQADGYGNGYEIGFSEGHAHNVTEKTQNLATLPPILSGITPAEPTVEPADSKDEAQITVYITNSGTKYHLDGCRHLKSKIEKTLAEAKALKLEPCKVCNPPN